MPAWWKGKGRGSKTKGPAGDAGGTVPVSAAVLRKDKEKNKKASSFDEALMAREGRGKQLEQPVGHPLPRPASMPSPLPSSGSASGSSGGSSSLGSSAASDEPPDLGIYRWFWWESSSTFQLRPAVVARGAASGGGEGLVAVELGGASPAGRRAGAGRDGRGRARSSAFGSVLLRRTALAAVYYKVERRPLLRGVWYGGGAAV